MQVPARKPVEDTQADPTGEFEKAMPHHFTRAAPNRAISSNNELAIFVS